MPVRRGWGNSSSGYFDRGFARCGAALGRGSSCSISIIAPPHIAHYSERRLGGGLKFFCALLCWVAIFGVANADPLPVGFQESRLNASNGPVVSSGEITFHIVPQDCSNVDYGNGETDCITGSTKNNIFYEKPANLGDTVEYKFDIWVDPAFSYQGYSQGETTRFGGKGRDSRLRIASWEGPARKNFIDMVKLDLSKGISFRFQQCQAPADFGKWVTFSMKVRWASDERGWIKVTCDDRVVFFAEGVVTNEQVHCYYGNECDPERPLKNAKQFFFQVGLGMAGWGPNWKDLTGPTIGPFTAFDEAGLTIKMRNISVTEGVELYSPEDKEVVRQLQEKLNALGCDVGKPDGVVGKRTKAQALTCRELLGMPETFDVTTVRTFLALYSAVNA
jgi:hypothetical protein